MEKKKITVRMLTESAIMIAIGTVLSLFPLDGFWIVGGGVTICSTLPLVIISHRYGCRYGWFTALVYGILQMVLGLNNVQYATSFGMAIAIIVLDYLAAYSVIGLSAMFDRAIKSRPANMVLGMAVTFALRLGCHFLSGWLIWDKLWPNEMGLAPAVYSIGYNASYMVPEFIITAVVGLLLIVPLGKYIYPADGAAQK